MSAEYSFHSLAGCSFGELYACHLRAFKDYPFQWSREALEKTIHRRGFDPALSFGAFYKGELVSFTWNGTGTYHDIATAYDTGTGTVEEHRGKGLASGIFEFSVPFLQQAGIRQYILEVLQDNEAARSVYTRQGFRVSRSFDCFRIQKAGWSPPASIHPGVLELKPIDLASLPQLESMPDFTPSWQNNFQALLKAPGDFVMLGAFRGDDFLGYGIVEPAGGDIPQLAVRKDERRKGIGSLILKHLADYIQADIIKIINIESTKAGIISFINHNQIPKIASQYEMIRDL